MPEENRNPFSVLYFPFTYIKENFLKPALCLFDGLTIFQPSEWQAVKTFDDAVKAGFLHYEVPSPAGSELLNLKRTVKEILSWGDVAYSSGQLENLKHLSDTGKDEDSEILSALRGKEKELPDDPAAASRIFLHLAQEHDCHQEEIDNISSRVNFSEEKLWSDLLVDGEETDLPAPSSLPPTHEDVAISARLAAWSRLFADTVESAHALLTTDKAVFDLLPPHEHLLSLPLPNLDGRSFEDALLLYKSPEIIKSVQMVKQQIGAVIEALSNSDELSLRQHMEAAKEISSSQAAVEYRKIIENESPRAPYSLSLYLFPDNSVQSLFKPDSEKGKALVFLLGKE